MKTGPHTCPVIVKWFIVSKGSTVILIAHNTSYYHSLYFLNSYSQELSLCTRPTGCVVVKHNKFLTMAPSINTCALFKYQLGYQLSNIFIICHSLSTCYDSTSNAMLPASFHIFFTFKIHSTIWLWTTYKIVVIRWMWEPGLHSCYGLDSLAFDSWQEQKISLFSKMCRLGLGPTQPPFQWVVEVREELYFYPPYMPLWYEHGEPFTFFVVGGEWCSFIHGWHQL